MRRWPLRFGGGLILVLGLVWVGQGFGFIPGSFMTGQIEWAWRGGAMAILSTGLFWWSTRAG